MSDKEHTKYPSRYKIGEAVYFVLLGEDKKPVYKAPAYIRSIIFTNSKVRYSIYLKYMKTTIHNVDSIFVEDSAESDELDFGDDNNS